MPKQEDALQSSVCYWLEVPASHKVPDVDDDEEEPEDEGDGLEEDEGKRHTTIDTEEVVVKTGVPQSLFVAYLSKEIDSTDACASLPFTLLLVISYALLAINHDDAPMVNAVEDSIGFDITENANFAFTGAFMGHKNIDDVNTHADFWSWMTRGFVPLLWVQSYSLAEGRNWSEPYVMQASEVYSRRNRGVLLHYNRIILGVRLSQERDAAVVDGSITGDCAFPGLQKMYDKDCVGGQGYELEPETFEARATKNPTRRHWLYINDDQEFIRQQLAQMELTGWLDENTRKIELAFPVYNAEYGLHTMFICCFFFSRGGHIWKDIIPLSAFAQNWNSFRSVFYDCMWLFCIAWIMFTEAMEILEILREHGALGLMTEYAGFWNAVDWLSVWSGLVIMTMFLINMNNIGAMNNALAVLGEIDEEFDRTNYRRYGKEYVLALEKEIQFAYNFRMVQALYPLVIALRLFKAFGSQPRLAVVTRTLETAWVDLFHFLIIFLSVFFTYTVAGVVLFGREVSSFTTLFRAMITCFRAMFGDFDWDELREVGRLDAFLWFLPFMVLIVLILLNMLIAIVMDAYDEVITSCDHEDGIWTMTKKAYATKMAKWKKEEIPMDEVLRGINAKIKEEIRRKKEEDEGQDLGDDIDSDDSDGKESKSKIKGRFMKKHKRIAATKDKEKEVLVTISGLKELFGERMHTHQAKKLIRDTILGYYAGHKEVGDINEVLTTIARIDYRTKQLRKKVKERVQAEGLAVNDPMKIHRLTKDCYAETDAAREDLATWLQEDEDDIKLPEYWLHPPLDQSLVEVEEDQYTIAGGEAMVAGGKKGPGLLGIMKHFSGREGGIGQSKVAADMHEGGTLQILADETLVLKACRDAGIAPTYDHLRKQAVGRHVQVKERDVDGTVLCRIPGVGEVWFAATAFVPSLIRHAKDEPAAEDDSTAVSDRSGSEALDRRAQELEQDVGHGKEVVEECLGALKTLHDDLMKMKADKRKGVEKFQQYRHQAVALQRGNVAEKERFKECQARVKEVTSERDNYFEQVKKLVKENHELEAQAELMNGRGGGGKRR